MKKLLFVIALPLVAISCGKGGPEGDAEKMCDMMKSWKEAKDAGKDDEADKIRSEGKKFDDELEEKYKADEKGKETMKKLVDECKDKYIK